MELVDFQKELAASLAGRQPVPEGVDPEALARARVSLEAKRRRAAGHLLPRLRTTLGPAWAARFQLHAERYIPVGLLHHVDDAWELAEALERESYGRDQKLWRAAHDDLVSMRLRHVRDPRQSALRIQERRGPLVAILSTPQRAVVVKLPGTPGRLWYLPI
ncbi:MAG: hypothetical protein ABUT39_06860 [Acidobacteriota bacterium]